MTTTNKEQPKIQSRRKPRKGKARPLDTTNFINEEFYVKKFTGRVTHFITMNPYKKDKRFLKLQRFSAAYDVLKKYTSHFLMVREFNQDGSSHYHAICDGFDVNRNPPKSMTFDVQLVGGKRLKRIFDTSVPPMSTLDKENHQVVDPLEREMGHHHLLEVTKKLLSYIWNMQRKAKARIKRNARSVINRGHVECVINYMCKDLPDIPIPFTDFFYRG